jgi:UDP-N-acetylglucosamine acyltransferase
MVEALAAVTVPPFVKAAREPISYVGINSVGLRRRGFDSKVIMQIQAIYRTLYQKKYNNTQAVNIMEAEMEATKERDEIILFIKNSPFPESGPHIETPNASIIVLFPL